MIQTDAQAIWQAGVDSVRGDRLVEECVQIDSSQLSVCGHVFPRSELGRVVVVGAGKASAAMAAGLEQAIAPCSWATERLSGWVNVPADCIRPLDRIHLHAARPAGRNEPTAEGVTGTQQILQLVQSLQSHDLCIALISGGASALLPAPIPGICWEDKRAVTRFLSSVGANIRELNCARRVLSSVKGGGLAAACQAGQMIGLIISDVLGDPLESIGSGPTVVQTENTWRHERSAALELLHRFDPRETQLPPSIYETLKLDPSRRQSSLPRSDCRVSNHVIGNLHSALTGAIREAERRHYPVRTLEIDCHEPTAEEVAERLLGAFVEVAHQGKKACLVSGGEPIVRLVTADQRGRGGRNQQLILAALKTLLQPGFPLLHPPRKFAFLSGGTDGEDGPTDAAGGILSHQTLLEANRIGITIEDITESLRRNNAYPLLDQLDSLLITGPTHTNVCDLRVILFDA